MGKPTESKVTRKMSRKMQRVTGEAPSDAAAVPEAATPQPIPVASHLMTRRERLLKKIYSSKKESSVKEGGAKRRLNSDKSKVAAAVVREEEDNDDDHGRGEGAGEENAVGGKRSTIISSSKRIQKVADAATLAMKKQQVDSAPSSYAAPTMKQLTSLNLSHGARHDMFVRELNQFNRVVDMPAFQQDPYASLQQHLDSTLKKLIPQTEDCGRRGGAVVSQSYGNYGNNNYNNYNSGSGGNYRSMAVAPQQPLPSATATPDAYPKRSSTFTKFPSQRRSAAQRK